MSPDDDGPGDFDRSAMIREDLLSLPRPLVVVEGALVSPELAAPSGNAVWLMPSQEEQRARLERRYPEGVHHGFLWGWQLIRNQLDAAPGATTIVVDGQTVAQTLAAVEAVFGEFIGNGPTAQAIDERQLLLRYANQTAVTHSLTGLARRPPGVDASEVVTAFDCECAAPTCDALIHLPVRDAAAALADPPPALLAPGHDCTAR